MSDEIAAVIWLCLIIGGGAGLCALFAWLGFRLGYDAGMTDAIRDYNSSGGWYQNGEARKF